MKKIIFTIMVCIAVLLSGCSVITSIVDPLPEDYKDGVRVPREYPDDDLKIYDDAIVFECEDDDEEINLSYGTTDDIDDVIDYYEDLFDDNDLNIIEMEDDRDEFKAKGTGDGYEFEIEAEEPRGNYESRAFKTVVDVEIKFTDTVEESLAPEPEASAAPEAVATEEPNETSAPANNNTGSNLDIVGFWYAVGTDGTIDDETKASGFAFEITGATIDMYINGKLDMQDAEYTFTDKDTIEFISDGEKVILDIKFESIGTNQCMTLDDGDTRVHLIAASYQDMVDYLASIGATVGGSDVVTIPLDKVLTDIELEHFISDFYWYNLYYLHADGSTEETNYNKMYFDSTDMTGADDHVDNGLRDITWYVESSKLYIVYSPDESMVFDMDYMFDGEKGYLYLYDDEEGYEGGAWIYYG